MKCLYLNVVKRDRLNVVSKDMKQFSVVQLEIKSVYFSCVKNIKKSLQALLCRQLFLTLPLWVKIYI